GGSQAGTGDGRRRGLAHFTHRRRRAGATRDGAAGQPRPGGAVGGLAGRGTCRTCRRRRRTSRRGRRRGRSRLQPRPRSAAGDRSGRADRAGVAGPLAMIARADCRSYCIVGGGISGLTAAYRLRAAVGDDASITLFDPADRLGGVLRTEPVGGQPMDLGAEAFVQRRPEVPALLAELGLSDRQQITTGVRPLLYSGQRLHPLPSETVAGIPSSSASVAGLVDDATIARIEAEPGRALNWSPGSDPAV